MKTNYLLVAILAFSVIGAFVSARGMKTAMAAAAAAVALYALLRQVI